MAIFLTILATTGSITVIAGLSRHIYKKFFKAKPRRAAVINYHNESSYPPYVSL
jgi:hypothetical protein